MGRDFIHVFFGGLMTVAMLTVIFGRKSDTANVLKEGFSGITNSIKAAMPE